MIAGHDGEYVPFQLIRLVGGGFVAGVTPAVRVDEIVEQTCVHDDAGIAGEAEGQRWGGRIGRVNRVTREEFGLPNKVSASAGSSLTWTSRYLPVLDVRHATRCSGANRFGWVS